MTQPRTNSPDMTGPWPDFPKKRGKDPNFQTSLETRALPLPENLKFKTSEMLFSALFMEKTPQATCISFKLGEILLRFKM